MKVIFVTDVKCHSQTRGLFYWCIFPHTTLCNRQWTS